MFLKELKQLAARLLARRPPPAGRSQDPDAAVRVPRKRGPGGRSTAAAVMEPEPDQWVDAVAGRWRRER
jgi:hypothetical protein